MANLHLVTGYAGQEHITSADQGSFNASFFGSGQYVLKRGNEMAASVVSNNQVRVLDGDIYMQGRHIRLNEGIYVDLAIENGTQGQNRNDLIVARYTKNASTGVEECNLVVIKGTATAGTASDPAYTKGDILNANALQNDMPLYRVQLNGLNVQPLVKLFATIEDVFSMLDVYRNSLRFRRLLTSVDDMNNLFEDGIYVYSTASVPKNAPFANAAVVEVFGADSTSTQKIQRGTRYGEAGQCKFRSLLGGTGWLDWVELAIATDGIVALANGGTGAKDAATARENLGAAPDGYGLGTAVTGNWSNIDSMYSTGWYRFHPSSAVNISNVTFDYAYMRVDSYNDKHIHQTLYPVYTNSKGTILHRTCHSGTWGEWEFENPPMVAGVEYRTTKRHNGSPVYTKLVDFGALPNATTTTVNTGIDSGATIVSVTGMAKETNAYEAVPFPFVYQHLVPYDIAAYAYTNRQTLGVSSCYDMSNWTAQFVLEYTK